jgi:hypothetical protein
LTIRLADDLSDIVKAEALQAKLPDICRLKLQAIEAEGGL